MSDDWDAVWDDGPPKFNPPQHATNQGKAHFTKLLIIQENLLFSVI